MHTIRSITNYWVLKMADYRRMLKIKPLLQLKNYISTKEFALLFAMATLILVAFSCKKDPVEVGLGIQPEGDMISVLFSDTSTLRAYSVANDSVRTDETILSLAGSYFDPVFGTSTAGFYTQILLSDNEADFGTSPVLDSMILSLSYNGYYGDASTPLTFRIYEISEDLSYDSIYYSNDVLAVEPVEIASFTFVPNNEDSVMVDSVMYPPHIRLNISEQNPALAEKILNGSEIQLADNEEFVKFIKGIYIIADPVENAGSIQYFSLTSSLSKVNLYYSNINYDSLEYEFRLDGDCARFNHFDNDYTNADPALRDQVTGVDSTLGSQKLYLQSMQGINTNFSLPWLESWKSNGKIAVTRAELVLPIIEFSSKYAPPSKLLLGTYDEEGELVQLQDYQEGASFFGGTYDSTRSEYRFRITRHVQQVLNGDRENSELVLLVSSRSVQANRVVIGGPQNASNALRVEMIYVPIE